MPRGLEPLLEPLLKRAADRCACVHLAVLPPFFFFLLIWFFFFFCFFLSLFLRLLRACFTAPFFLFLISQGGSDQSPRGSWAQDPSRSPVHAASPALRRLRPKGQGERGPAWDGGSPQMDCASERRLAVRRWHYAASRLPKALLPKAWAPKGLARALGFPLFAWGLTRGRRRRSGARGLSEGPPLRNRLRLAWMTGEGGRVRWTARAPADPGPRTLAGPRSMPPHPR